MKPESQFRSKLSALLSGQGAHPQPIETLTANGVPDLEFCWHSQTAWIELKIARPAVHLRPQQFIWSVNRRKAGGRVVLVAQFSVKGDTYMKLVPVPMDPREMEITQGDEPEYIVPHLGAPIYAIDAKGTQDLICDIFHN